MKRLIVNADDLGYSPGTNAGILRAHRQGIVTSASFMTNVPAPDSLVHLLRSTPTLDVGVHLVLTHGRPLSDPGTVPSLVGPDGTFLRPSEILGTGRVRAEDVLREYRAQYAHGRELLGHEPTNVDTHHWVQAEPAVFEAYATLASETGAAARNLDPGERDRLRAGGIRTPDRMRREFHDTATSVDELRALLASIASDGEGVSELMCHPSEPDPELERRSTYALQRYRELASLVDPAVRATVDELGLVLSTFAELR